MTAINNDIQAYNDNRTAEYGAVCQLLAEVIEGGLAKTESKIWHGHPVWFIDGNPIVGYSEQKAGVRLIFWSGADFGEELLDVRGGKFKDASILYTHESQINESDMQRWLEKSRTIQWDYKNIVKRKGKLERLV